MIHQVRPLKGDKTAGAAHDQGWRQQGGQQEGRRDRRQGISQVEENVRKTILEKKNFLYNILDITICGGGQHTKSEPPD